ncbi:PAN domain-containing protein 8 [Elsinoe australis]|uniref:PAN domain-containing protein 8 n=1 Tax=Elsinoe australis TaxID=40998 RepID=A0A4V6DWJ9_9PEZI|nr:PAN domain-containing protein 8 [Elsinoe australis]
MRAFLALSALAGLALAQDTATLLTGPPMGVYKTANNKPAITATTLTDVTAVATGLRKRGEVTTPTGPPMGVYKTANVQAPLTAETLSVAATAAPAVVKRDATLAKRDDVCVAQPTGISYVTVPDDPNSFVKDTYYSTAADNAVTPQDYTQVFSDIVAANSADNYMGFTFLQSYDVAGCASQCTAISGCTSFNIYFERDPVMAPDASACPNPPSLTRIKCVWWGGLVSLDNANNYGNLQANFYVAVAGSNGYENTARAAALRAATPTVAGATIATETASAGSVWIVYYSADSSTGAYANAAASGSYADCEVACDARTDGCKAFTYVGGANGTGSGTCWLKTSLGTPSLSGNNVVSAVRAAGNSNSNAASSSVVTTTTTTTTTTVAPTTVASTVAATTVVQVASSAAAPSSSTSSTTSTTSTTLYRPSYGSGSSTLQTITTVTYSAAPTTAGSSSSITTPPSSASTKTTTTTTTSATPISRYTSDMNCTQMSAVSSTYSDSSNAYIIQCQRDLYHLGDVGSYNAGSFYGCFSACSNFNGCQAFSYYSGVCYFKNLNGINVAPTVATLDFAYVARYYTGLPAAAASTTTTTTTTTTVAPTTTKAPTTTTTTTTVAPTTTPAPTTFSTAGIGQKFGSATSAAVTTTKTTSTASPTPTAFYIQVGGWNDPNNKYAYVNWWTGGKVQFTNSKSGATIFNIDSRGYLRNQDWIWLLNGYIGLVDRLGGAWQRMGFRPSGTDPAKCWIQDGFVMCNNSAGFIFAGTCNNDGYLYLGAAAQMPRQCGWTGLYPVAA